MTEPIATKEDPMIKKGMSYSDRTSSRHNHNNINDKSSGESLEQLLREIRQMLLKAEIAAK